MTLANLLSESQIVPSMVSGERWEAIAELVDCLVKAGKIQQQDRDNVLDSIRQREETMSTGMPRLIKWTRSLRRSGAR